MLCLCPSCGGMVERASTAAAGVWACSRCGWSAAAAPETCDVKSLGALARAAFSDDVGREPGLEALAKIGPRALPALGMCGYGAAGRSTNWSLGLTLLGTALLMIWRFALEESGIFRSVVFAVLGLMLLGAASLVIRMAVRWVRGRKKIGSFKAGALRAAERAACTPGDPHAIRWLVGGAMWPLTHRASIDRLAGAADAMTEADASHIPADDLEALTKALPPPEGRLSRKEHGEVVRAAARILGKAVYRPALRNLRIVATAFPTRSTRVRDVRGEARRAIQVIEAASKLGKARTQLLRAAPDGEMDSARLLRPAGKPDIPPEQLLRRTDE